MSADFLTLPQAPRLTLANLTVNRCIGCDHCQRNVTVPVNAATFTPHCAWDGKDDVRMIFDRLRFLDPRRFFKKKEPAEAGEADALAPEMTRARMGGARSPGMRRIMRRQLTGRRRARARGTRRRCSTRAHPAAPSRLTPSSRDHAATKKGLPRWGQALFLSDGRRRQRPVMIRSTSCFTVGMKPLL